MSRDLIYFDPPLEKVYSDIDKALKDSMEVDIPIWQAIENIVLDWQQRHWAAISSFPLAKSTIEKKKSLVKHGKKIRVSSKGGRAETAKYVTQAGHLTGFLAERLTSSDRLRNYNVPRYEKAGQTARGHYEFGIDPEYFRDEYPLMLAKWLSQRIPEEVALLAIDESRLNQLSAFLWDRVWEKIYGNLMEAS